MVCSWCWSDGEIQCAGSYSQPRAAYADCDVNVCQTTMCCSYCLMWLPRPRALVMRVAVLSWPGVACPPDCTDLAQQTICVMTSSGIWEHVSWPFLDQSRGSEKKKSSLFPNQSLCEHSGGLVGPTCTVGPRLLNNCIYIGSKVWYSTDLHQNSFLRPFPAISTMYNIDLLAYTRQYYKSSLRSPTSKTWRTLNKTEALKIKSDSGASPDGLPLLVAVSHTAGAG